MEMGSRKEAVVVCSDKNMGIGISVFDLEIGDRLLHIPTCAASPHGLLCLRNEFLVASQINRHGSLGGGAIFMWPLNKPQSPFRSYTMEAIGLISCTNDGMYVAGAAPSGNVYVWEVASGRLLKRWRAHHKSFKCMIFSGDDSLLLCGSEDGIIYVWSLISLLDVDDSRSLPSVLHTLSEHRSSITGLVMRTCSTNSILISGSLDATCKVWDLISGSVIQTRAYSASVTAMTVDSVGQLLFSGTMDGRIFVNELEIGAMEDSLIPAEDQAVMLKGHNGSITALTFCGSGLLSASEDCTFCLWDVTKRKIVRRFNHQKGAVTNLLVIPLSSLIPSPNQQRGSKNFHVSLLEKYPQSNLINHGMLTSLSSSLSLNKQQSVTDFPRAYLPDHQVLHSELMSTPAAMQMKVERSVHDRLRAISATRHVIEMNTHLQSRLLNLMQCRLLWSSETGSSTESRRNIPAMNMDSAEDEEKQVQSSG